VTHGNIVKSQMTDRTSQRWIWVAGCRKGQTQHFRIVVTSSQ